jgi:hypothetical protein
MKPRGQGDGGFEMGEPCSKGPAFLTSGYSNRSFHSNFFTMTVKKKRELVLGPLLTSRGSFALPHQKTFDRCRFPPFRRKSLSPAPPALQMHETTEEGCPPSTIPHTRNAGRKRKARNTDAKPRFLSSSWFRNINLSPFR